MKNKILFFIIVSLVAFGITSITSCKRKKVDDPNVTGHATFRISLSGTANPSTLYVPATQPAAATVITVRALNNDGSPVANKQIIFQEGGYGYFEGYRISDVRTTNANGVATITFYIPPAANIKNTTMANILATLVDDGSLDVSISDVNDVIPIKIVPYVEQGIILHGRVTTPPGNGVADVTVTLAGDGGNASGIAITRSSGSYEFYVASGWYGTITPEAEGYSFTPSSYTFDQATPITVDMQYLDFVANFDGGNTLAADVTQYDVEPPGGSTTVNVYNSTGDANIGFSIVPEADWISVSKHSGTTPDSFVLTVAPNETGEDRSANVVITATDTASSSVSIAVNQAGDEAPAYAKLATDVTEINATNATTSRSVNVYNSVTPDPIDYSITTEYDPSDEYKNWVTPSATSGTTDDSFNILVSSNYGPARTAYVWLMPISTGVTGNIRITVNQEMGDYLQLSTETWTVDSTGGTTVISVTNPNGDPLSFSGTSSASWLTLSPASGTTPTDITITVAPNATSLQRSATITFIDANTPTSKPVTLHVTQN